MEVETTTGSVVVEGDCLQLLAVFKRYVQLGLCGTLGVDTEKRGFIPGEVPFQGSIVYQCVSAEVSVTSPSVVVVELQFSAEEMGKVADNAVNWSSGEAIVGFTRLLSGYNPGMVDTDYPGGGERGGLRGRNGGENQTGISGDVPRIAGVPLDQF